MSGEQWGEAVDALAAELWHDSNPGMPVRDCDAWQECVGMARRALGKAAPLIVADTRRKVAEEQGETFEEWRVTGQPGDGYPAYDFTWTPDRTGPDPERDARSFIRLHDAAGVPWNDGPHLSRRVVTRTAWQAIARGSGNGDSGQNVPTGSQPI